MSESPDPVVEPVVAPAPEPVVEPAVEPANPLANSPLGEPAVEPGPKEGEEKPAPKEGEEEVKPALTPASYEFTLPEGVAVNAETLSTLKDTLAAAQVPPEVGQSLIDLHIAELNRSAEAFVAENARAWTEVTDGWKAAIEADPELGGDAKPKVTGAIARALDTYGSPEARQAFDMTGAGWNPSIIKMIYRMASALDEGSPHPASGPLSRKGQTPGQTLYENDGHGPSNPGT